MRNPLRGVLRVGAMVVAVVGLVGVPIVIARTVGVPAPSAAQWRRLWRTHQVDNDFAVHAGAALFVVLWAWFALTGLVEAARLVVGSAPPEVEAGAASPSAWVRRLVRFIVISSVAATGATILLTAGGQRTTSVPQRPSVTSAPSTSAPSATGEQAIAVDHGSGLAATTAELATASLLCAGTILAIRARRRRRLRESSVGAYAARPSLAQVRMEVMLHSTSAAERIARLDFALRSVAAELQDSGASILAVRVGDDGTIRLRLSTDVDPHDTRWIAEVGASWTLPGSVPLTDLAVDALARACPAPSLVSVGSLPDGGECFVDVVAVRVLAVDSPQAPRILRSMAASYALSPFLEGGMVLTVGLGDFSFVDRPARSVATLDEAIEGARATDERPVVIVGVGESADATTLERRIQHGEFEGLGAVVEATDLQTDYRLRFDGTRHLLDPFGWEVVPPGLSSSTLRAIESAVEDAGRPLERTADVVPIMRPARAAAFSEPAWSLLVRVLGQVEVVSADGLTVPFERSKALELVVWLVLHRERPTRSKARAALWDADVRDATFANVVSDARRAMARVMPPAENDEWIGRTLTEDLPLHPLVVSDADLLAARMEAARGLPSGEAIDVLRPGLDLVTGLPFESCSYLWPDAEGHTSALVLLATGAAIELASHYLALGDIDGVFWATGQGLKVLSGHEELIAMRMRACAMRGDLAAVRHEWESYERALAADPWAAAVPAPKLVALRKELLAHTWPEATRAAGA